MKKNLFIIYLLIFGSNLINAQSYFFFQYKIGYPQKDSVTYLSFITVREDGSAFGRTRYIEPVTGEDHLLDMVLIDSIQDFYTTNEPIKYLMMPSNPQNITGSEDPDILWTRFVFERDDQSIEKLYEPKGVEYSNFSERWFPAKTDTIVSFQLNELNPLVVSRFYGETEEYYTLLFKPDTRNVSLKNKNATLHLIYVADTADAKIGSHCKKDVENITVFFKTLTLQAGIKYNLNRIIGTKFKKENVLKAVNDLNPGPDDIVIFYYSGHGFRYSNDASPYPRMSIRENTIRQQLRENINISVEDIYNIIIKKNAKVNLVIGDCCNEKIDAPVPFGRDWLRTRSLTFRNVGLNIPNVEALFFPATKTNIIVSSSDINQLAISNPGRGGYFTSNFKNVLSSNLYTDKQRVSWENIFVETKQKTTWDALAALCNNTANGRCRQVPTFQVAGF